MKTDWTFYHPRMTLDHLGLIPDMLDDNNPTSAKAQLHSGYLHGGGWRPFKGFKLLDDNSLKYPGDPIYPVRATAKLRNETIAFYDHSWVAVIQPDRSFEVCRMD